MVYADDMYVLSCDSGVVPNSDKPFWPACVAELEMTLSRVEYQLNILSGYLKTLSLPIEDLLTNEWIRVEEIGAYRKRSAAKFFSKHAVESLIAAKSGFFTGAPPNQLHPAFLLLTVCWPIWWAV